MQIKKCARCKTRPAVIFVSRETNGKMEQVGYCIRCAKELKLKPIDDILKNMGISDEDLESMSEEIEQLMPMPESDEEEGTAPALDLNAVFNEGRPGGDHRADPKTADQKAAQKKRKCLSAFCIDLTARAREGKLDRVVGRTLEIERVSQILCRRQKNNPCLIGEPGVGKTAVAEALAQKIAAGDVPYKLRDKEVFLVDMTAIVAGTQFRGQFENRMKGLIDEVRENGNIILVIDEIHSIVG
ncbi:MAG: ATP-dependent Clp protease ATP-binding subunit, partial [Clostridia bacterium]|nr:ATP-dependent Clp protease ATP-binding subunit [Clostridia bacterium]